MPRERKQAARFDPETDGANDTTKRYGKEVKKTIKKKKAETGEKKKRGRPAGSKNEGKSIPEPEKKKRGRPAGSKNKEKAAKTTTTETEPEKPLKFTYFRVMAKGLQPVLCLEVGGVAYTGGPAEDWPALKPSTPFGQLPLLEDEAAGVSMAQSAAICNYIGRKAGLLGETDAEFATSQMLMQEGEDLYNLMQKFVATTFVSIEKKQGPEGFNTFLEEQFPKHAASLDALLKGSTKFTKSGSTVGELYLFGMLHQLMLVKDTVLYATKDLKSFYESLLKNTGVKKVLAGESAFGEFVQYFKQP